MKQTELNKLKELLLEGEYKLVTIETELEKAKKVPRSQQGSKTNNFGYPP